MKERSRRNSLEGIAILLVSFVIQVALLFIVSGSDNLKNVFEFKFLSLFVCTALALAVNVLLWLLTRHNAAIGLALICSVVFWIIVCNVYDYRERTRGTRERINASDEYLERSALVKERVERSLRKKNILFKWLPDSLCFKIYRHDSSCYAGIQL